VRIAVGQDGDTGDLSALPNELSLGQLQVKSRRNKGVQVGRRAAILPKKRVVRVF